MFKIDIREQDGVVLIHPEEDLIHKKVLKLKTMVDEAIEHGKTKFILDLDNVEFVGSAGIGVMVVIATRVQSVKGRFLLTNVPENFDRLFSRLKVDHMFQIFPDNQTALGAIHDAQA